MAWSFADAAHDPLDGELPVLEPLHSVPRSARRLHGYAPALARLEASAPLGYSPPALALLGDAPPALALLGDAPPALAPVGDGHPALRAEVVDIDRPLAPHKLGPAAPEKVARGLDLA